MAQEMRVGFAGLTHGHVWGLINSFREAEGSKLMAVADGTPLLEKAKDGFERSYSSWEEMLEREELDALVVTSDNLESSEITVQALRKGIPCLVEKPMAANVVDAQRMLDAQRESGKTLMINWPFAWASWMDEFGRQVEAKSMGEVFHLRFRNGHRGPREIGCDEYFCGWLYDEAKNGGGAIADFGSYGAVLCRWLLGMPEKVYCVRGNYTKDYEVADDHALILLQYPKANAALEATWATQQWEPAGNPVIYGNTGTLAVVEGELRLGTDAISLPAKTEGPAAAFFRYIQTGETPAGVLNPEYSADATRILDAAIRSSKSGCAESL
jgi:predicted dehydrogenase